MVSTLSAQQGNAIAQCNLGVMYGMGRGVPQDYAEALKWIRLSAAQGYANAQCGLGVMYEYGMGVPKDLTIAKEWYDKACKNGYEKGCAASRRLAGAEK
jgi:TPR repeat protein